MEINFHIPDFVCHNLLNLALIDLIEESPEYFHDGLKIASVFGAFEGCVWNGGRLFHGMPNINKASEILKTYDKKKIPLRFTFTNPMLKEEHLSDPFCNQILKKACNGLNEVIVMSPLLEEYIRKHYRKYKLTSSTCKEIRGIAGITEELKKDYKYVVLDYNMNNNFTLLNQIDEADRHKCELLVNACCRPGCPRRGDHYRTIGENQISEWKARKYMLPINLAKLQEFPCRYSGQKIDEIKDRPAHISPQAIFEKYLPLGYTHFKIEGRTTTDQNLIETYVYYMVKPEYQEQVRTILNSKITEQ